MNNIEKRIWIKDKVEDAVTNQLDQVNIFLWFQVSDMTFHPVRDQIWDQVSYHIVDAVEEVMD